MAKQIVNTGGALLLGSGSGAPSSYYDGTETRSNTLTKTITTTDAQAVGDEYPESEVTRRSFEISGTVFATVAGGGGLFSIGDSCYATYKSQNGTTLFAGNCKVTSITDGQSQGEYETQDISLRSSGAPDVVANS